MDLLIHFWGLKYNPETAIMMAQTKVQTANIFMVHLTKDTEKHESPLLQHFALS
jgi:hypothetical protein